MVSATWTSTIMPILFMVAGGVALVQIRPLLWGFIIGLGLLVAGLALWQTKAHLIVK